MTLLEQQVKSSIKENRINKRLANYSLAITKSKPKKAPKVQVPPDDANSLLNRIIASSLNEAAITKRLNDISYGAINGERQEVKSYQPEGTVMLGQLGREKPLDAITKEMIEGYQQDLNKPYFVDGEARQYSESGYTPVLQVPVDYKDIADENATLMAEREKVANVIKDADDNISNLNKYNHWNWRTTDDDLENMGVSFNDLIHYEIIDQKKLKSLTPVNARLREACFLGSDLSGLYKV
jgi:hypothetical protein